MILNKAISNYFGILAGSEKNVINDTIKAGLVAHGYTGTVNGALQQYLSDIGYGSILAQSHGKFMNALRAKSLTTYATGSKVATNGFINSDSLASMGADNASKSAGEVNWLDGLPATKLTVTTAHASGNGELLQGYLPASTAADNFSIYARAPAGVSYTLNIAAFRVSDANVAGISAVTVTENWQRFSLPFTPFDTTAHGLYFGNQGASGITGTFGVNNGEFIYVAGGQLTNGADLQPYISTGR